MKRLIAFILQTFCVIVMQAQNLVVQSFRMDETDLTANLLVRLLLTKTATSVHLSRLRLP